MINRMVDGDFVLANDVYDRVQRFHLRAPQAQVSCQKDSVVLPSIEPMRVVSSGMIGGGWATAQHAA